MKLTNLQIYNYAVALTTHFQSEEQRFPIKANFYLLKNKNTLVGLAQEIEQERSKVLQENGVLNEETQQYEVSAEKMNVVNQELSDLFSLTQDVHIYTTSIESFGDAELTTAQMEALMFMIED